VTGFLATIAARILPRNLTPASGRQDHTLLPSASATFVFVTSASTASHRNVRDDREPPLIRVRQAKSSGDLPDMLSEIFLIFGLDTTSENQN
jgi:hypothetical protein